MSLPLAAATCAIIAPAEAGPIDRWQAHISEAATRFGVPETWIYAVIDIESKGDPRVVSVKGAIGLMQLMPRTWEELRLPHHLGADPLDPRANILAGTAYLKAMHERFGYPDLFAAYNAGPTRYAKLLQAGKPLPAETRAYLSKLEKALSVFSGAYARFTPQGMNRALAPAGSGQTFSKSRLFFPLSTTGSRDRDDAFSAPSVDIFVPLSTWKRDHK